MRSNEQPEVVRPRPPDHQRASYVVPALSHPATILPLLGGISFATLAGSLTVAVIAIIGAAIAVALLSGWSVFQHDADRRRRLAENRKREDRLDDAGVCRAQLEELTGIVDELVPQADGETRGELAELLDRYVALLLWRERWVRAMARTDRRQLIRERDAIAANPATARSTRAQIVERRIRCWDESQRAADRASEELATIEHLIGWLGQRAMSSGASPLVPAEVDRRIEELDELDAAARQLLADGDPTAEAPGAGDRDGGLAVDGGMFESWSRLPRWAT